MQVVRKEIGVFPDARYRFILPPKDCIETRTIFLNEMKILTMFQDKRLIAVSYMEAILKAIGVPQSDKILKWFYHEMPPSGYLEMDYPTGRLSFCCLEKISP